MVAGAFRQNACFLSQFPRIYDCVLYRFRDITTCLRVNSLCDQSELQKYFCSKQEAQLMLTNPRDAVRGQSGSRSTVPFHMLIIVSY